MGRIILTFAGPWSKPPKIKTPFELTFGEPDPEVADEIIAVARVSSALSPEEARAVRKHEGLLGAEVEFEGPGDHTWAERAARLILDAFALGALAAYVETADKVFGPGALKTADPRDPQTLFHLLVEVLGDGRRIATEGMQSFDLPDVAAPYAGKAELGPAQGAVFACAALMACEGLRPEAGGRFQASESMPAFTFRFEAPAGDPAEDPFVNPRGTWLLIRP